MSKIKTVMVLFLVLGIIMVLPGCINNNPDQVIKHKYAFVGGNNDWEAQYSINGDTNTTDYNNKNFKTTYTEELSVSYKGDPAALADVEEIQFAYETSAGGGKLIVPYREYKPKTNFYGSWLKNGAVPQKDETVKITIYLDGAEAAEKLELKNNG